MTKRLLEKNLPRAAYAGLLAAVVLGRLLVAYCQRVYLLPEGSALDDMLMVRAAQSLTAGEWLGPYGAFAMAKNMGFALWLALLHALRIPLLWGNAALWTGASLFAAWALRPVFRGNLSRLAVFAFFAFQPVSFAFFNLRPYRDSIFPAFCLLFFAGVAGLGLRVRIPSLRGSVLASLGAGAGLAGAWLLREDGASLLPFAVCGLGVIALYLVWHRKTLRALPKILLAALPFGVLLAGVLAFSAANAAQYGVFAVNDLTNGSFPKAYAGLAAVSEAETGWRRYTPVTQTALQKMYREIPSLARLEPSLSEGPAYSGFSDKATGEFGGSFYFALRLAAQYEGLTPDAQTADAFWRRMQTETEAAVAEGRLQSLSAGASTLPRWNAALLAPTLRETGWGALAVLGFADCDARPQESVGPEEKIQEVAAYLHSPVQQGYVAGTDQPYYNPVQRVCFLLCSLLVWAYRVLVWPLLFLSAATLARGLRRGLRAKTFSAGLLWAVLLLGLLLSAVLRLGVAGYMEAAAFGIGTYIMYLSPAVPPLLLFLALGAGLAARRAGEGKDGEAAWRN